MIQVLYVSSVSACFELENEKPFYAPQSYTVFLNEQKLFEDHRNVFSVFGLQPGSENTVELLYEDGTSERVVFSAEKTLCGINVKDFGAKGDGVNDDSEAIQAAIHFLPKGGLLHFPAGTYLTAPLALKSHMTIEFAENATILGRTERSCYQVLPGEVEDMYSEDSTIFSAFEGNVMSMYQSLIHAAYAEDITVIGPGCVDGNAVNSDWWQGFKENPVARPRLFFFNHCKDITIHGITGKNSASWQFHPFFSQNVRLLDVYVEAPKDSPNTDAMDPESCDHVDIIGCRFSVGDDCIAIKSGKIELGKKYKTPADHHTIRNCLMNFGHGAVTLGSEIGAGVKNLSVSQCYFRGTDRGLRIKTRRGRGQDCVLDGILFENILMEGVLTPVGINMWYNCCDPDRFSEYVWSREHLPVDERTPHLGSFTFRNLTCTDVQVAACYIDGLPEMPIDEVIFENTSFAYAEDALPGKPIMKNHAEDVCKLGLYLDNVRHIKLDGVTVNGSDGPGLITAHYEQLETPDFKEV